MGEESITVLWVDDDINNSRLRVERDEFEENGITIIKAENPDECWEQLENSNKVDLIILDISMPLGVKIKPQESLGGMRTGLVLLKKLMEKEQTKGIKKIVYTIVDDNDVMDYCSENNIPYLSKQEIFPEELVEEVKQMIISHEQKQ